MRLPNIRPGTSLGHRVVTRIASTALGITVIRKVGPRIDPTLIRLTGGRLSSVTPFPALLLSHTGARTGVTRTTPIVYFTDAGRVIVIASNFGAPKNPAWYYNIKANPEVTLLGRGFRGPSSPRKWLVPNATDCSTSRRVRRRHTTITSSRRQPDRSP